MPALKVDVDINHSMNAACGWFLTPQHAVCISHVRFTCSKGCTEEALLLATLLMPLPLYGGGSAGLLQQLWLPVCKTCGRKPASPAHRHQGASQPQAQQAAVGPRQHAATPPLALQLCPQQHGRRRTVCLCSALARTQSLRLGTLAVGWMWRVSHSCWHWCSGH